MARHIPPVQQNRQNNGMVARIEEKWCVTHSHIDNVVRCKHRKCQMLTLASKSSFDIWSQEILHDLNHPLTLTISLWMKRRTKPEICTEQVKKGLPKRAGKMGILIRYYHLGETV